MMAIMATTVNTNTSFSFISAVDLNFAIICPEN
jgi:hypothetical protein